MLSTKRALPCVGVVLLVAALAGIQVIRAHPADARKRAPNEPPQISLTSPAPGSYLGPVTITAEAKDSNGFIKAVRFYADRKPIGKSTAPVAGSIFQVTWANAKPGSYRLTAVAVDNQGAETTSGGVNITILRPNMPPIVRMTGPNEGEVFTEPATIDFMLRARDRDGGVTMVQVFADADVLIGTDTTGEHPGRGGHGRGFQRYSIAWENVPPGSHVVWAVATDDDGATAASEPVHITVNPASDDGDGEGAPVPEPAPLVYVGAFRVPIDRAPGAGLTDWQAERASFEFGGGALAFRPSSDPAGNGSLFIVGNDQANLVAEIDIPTPVDATSLADLPTANILQNFVEATEGGADTVNPGSPNPKRIGGMLPAADRLYISVYDTYDANGSQLVSHFVSGLNLSTVGDTSGPYQLENTGCDPLVDESLPWTDLRTVCRGAGFFDGYFGLVPPAWQASLGGPVLNGNCCLGIISRTSYGPALYAIDPAQLGVANPLPATPLLYYPSKHPLLDPGVSPCTDFSTCDPVVDGWSNTSQVFNGTSEVRGVVFVPGRERVLFFGRHGLGAFCYGPGTDDPDLAGTPAPGGLDTYCLDPEDANKGVHAWPYKYYVWDYSAADLAAVKAGALQPWDLRPMVWRLDLPFVADNTHLGGATYDPATGRIYVSQYQGDGTLPVIHVFVAP